MSDLTSLPALTLATHPAVGRLLYASGQKPDRDGLFSVLPLDRDRSEGAYAHPDNLTDLTPVRLVPEGHVVLDPESNENDEALRDLLHREGGARFWIDDGVVKSALQVLANRQARTRAAAANPEPEGLGEDALAIHPATGEAWRRDVTGAWFRECTVGDPEEMPWADTGLTDADIKWRGEGA